MNKLLLTGHLGADPKLAEATNREKYCHFNLATDEYWRDPAGQRQKRTEWHSIFFWGARAEVLATLVKKGSKLLVEGRLESRRLLSSASAVTPPPSALPPQRAFSCPLFGDDRSPMVGRVILNAPLPPPTPQRHSIR